MNEFEIRKVEHPALAGIPGGKPWAVVKKQEHGDEVVDSFRTRKAALAYIAEHTPCEVCDELGHREEQHTPSNV